MYYVSEDKRVLCSRICCDDHWWCMMICDYTVFVVDGNQQSLISFRLLCQNSQYQGPCDVWQISNNNNTVSHCVIPAQSLICSVIAIHHTAGRPHTKEWISISFVTAYFFMQKPVSVGLCSANNIAIGQKIISDYSTVLLVPPISTVDVYRGIMYLYLQRFFCLSQNKTELDWTESGPQIQAGSSRSQTRWFLNKTLM